MMGWTTIAAIVISIAFSVWLWSTVKMAENTFAKSRKLIDELIEFRDRKIAECDSLLMENDTMKRERAELQRIIDDYRRWMRESIKLMPDSVKHASDVQLVERHRPRPATEVKP